MTDQNMMKDEERKEFTKRMETRRAEQRQIVADEIKAQKKEGADVSDIDRALGLDNDDEMFMPELGGGYGGHPFGGGGFNSEEEALAAAIAASLQDSNPGGMQS